MTARSYQLRGLGIGSPPPMVITHRNLEINHLLGKGRHLVVEAEAVFSDALGCEDKVALSLFGSIHDDLVTGRGHGEIDIEGATGLDLQ